MGGFHGINPFVKVRFTSLFQGLKMWLIFIILSYDSTRTHFVRACAYLTN